MLNFTVRVRHTTKRKPMLTEWIVLQALGTAEHNQRYKRVSVKDITEQVFGFHNASDSLIRPALLGLKERDIITADTLSDSTKMSNLMLGDVHVTERGRIFRQEGVLWSEPSENSLTMQYNPGSCKFSLGTGNNGAAEPDGIPIQEAEELLGKLAFPEGPIRQYLDSLKSRHNPYSDWLTTQSVIEEIEQLERTLSWVPLKRDLTWDRSGCHINGVSDNIAEFALSSLSIIELGDEGLNGPEWPLLSGFDPDTSLNHFYQAATREALLKETYSTSRILVIRQKDYNTMQSEANDQSPRFLVLTEAPEDHIEQMTDGKLLISIKQALIPSDVLLIGNDKLIRSGRAELVAGNIRREMPFFYEPRDNAHLLGSVCEQIAEYEGIDHRAVFLLRAIGQKALSERILASRLQKEPKEQQNVLRESIERDANLTFTVRLPGKQGKSSKKKTKRGK